VTGEQLPIKGIHRSTTPALINSTQWDDAERCGGTIRTARDLLVLVPRRVARGSTARGYDSE
jgi:hypothetical protein